MHVDLFHAWQQLLGTLAMELSPTVMTLSSLIAS